MQVFLEVDGTTWAPLSTPRAAASPLSYTATSPIEMVVCSGTSLASLGDTCVRELWAGVVPFAFVGIVLVSTTPPARFLLRTITKPFTNFLTLREAEALISGNENIPEEDRENAAPLWRTLVLSTASLVESLFWIGLGCYSLILHSEDVWGGIRDFLVAITWFYAALRLIIKPTATVPHDLLVLIGIHLVFGTIIFFGHLYDSYAYALPPPNTFRLTAEIVNLLAVIGMFCVILNTPLEIPSKQVEKNNIVSYIQSLWYAENLHLYLSGHVRLSRGLHDRVGMDVVPLVDALAETRGEYYPEGEGCMVAKPHYAISPVAHQVLAYYRQTPQTYLGDKFPRSHLGFRPDIR